MEWNKTAYTPEMLAALDADELTQLLHAQLQKRTCEMDDAFVRQLLKELEARGKDPTLTDDAAVERACEKFRQDTAKASGRKRSWYRSWMVTAASVAVVLGILVFTLPGTAEAENIRDVLTRWTDSVFHFFSPGESAYAAQDYVFETDNPGLQQIYDEVVALGITDPVVPMWVPEGSELKDIELFVFGGDKSLAAEIMNNNTFIYITVIVHGEDAPFQYEKDVENVEIIEVAGVEHYMMSNNDAYIVTWMIDMVEYSIMTDCREEDVHKLLNSIYTPEG